jgi:glycosyltransferase involved in cell wall biosynthesis
VSRRVLWAALGAVALGGALAVRDRRARERRLDRRFGDLVVSLALRDAAAPPEPDGRPVVAVVIPAFNEADAIVGVLAALPTELAGHRVEPVVVVDGGTDGTADAARAAGFTTLVHPVNRGQGDALRTGFAYAVERGAAIVMTMDADGQHRPEDMPALVAPIVAGDADYVQGSRFLGEYDDAGGARDLGIRAFTRLINAVSGAGLTDCTNGFRAVRVERLATMHLEEPRFSAPEIIIEAARHGLRIQEVPVHIRARSHGESKKPRRLGYPLGFLGVIVRTARRGRTR